MQNSRAISANEVEVATPPYFSTRSAVVSERFFFLSITLLIFAAVFYGFGLNMCNFEQNIFHSPAYSSTSTRHCFSHGWFFC